MAGDAQPTMKVTQVSRMALENEQVQPQRWAGPGLSSTRREAAAAGWRAGGPLPARHSYCCFMPACCLLPSQQEEMAAANIDMVSRDFCAHILIKLNECRCVRGRRAGLSVGSTVRLNRMLCVVVPG